MACLCSIASAIACTVTVTMAGYFFLELKGERNLGENEQETVLRAGSNVHIYCTRFFQTSRKIMVICDKKD